MGEQQSLVPQHEGPPEERLPGPETIMVAGDNLVIRRTERGLVQSLIAEVPLTAQHDEIYSLSQRKNVDGEWCWVNKWQPTAAGYERLNGVAGIHMVTPPVLSVDGREQPNPYIQRDEHGTPLSVFIRKVGLGRSKVGNLVAQDATLYLHPRSYLIAMIHKQKMLEQGGIAELITAQAWEQLDKAEQLKHWWLPTMQGLGLKVLIGGERFVKLHKAYAEMIQFLDRRASTICTRNVLKHHPGMAIQVVHCERGVARVRVMGWPASDHEFRAINRAAAQIATGETPPDVQVQSAPIEEADPDNAPEALGDDAPRPEDDPGDLDGAQVIDVVDESVPQAGVENGDEGQGSLDYSADDIPAFKKGARTKANHTPQD